VKSSFVLYLIFYTDCKNYYSQLWRDRPLEIRSTRGLDSITNGSYSIKVANGNRLLKKNMMNN